MSTGEAKLVAKNYVKLLKQKGLKFTKVYLFGSYAKGEQHKHSDIDIAVLLRRRETKDLEKALDQKGEYSDVGREVDNRIETILLTDSEVKKDTVSIMGHQVYTTGIRII